MSATPIPAFRHSEQTKEEAYSLWKKGNTLEEVAVALSIPTGTVRKWSSAHKWKEKLLWEQTKPSVTSSAVSRLVAAEAKEEAGEQEKTLEAKLAEVSGLDLEGRQEKFTETMQLVGLKVALAMASMPTEELVRNAEKLKHLEQMGRRALGMEEQQMQPVINIGILSQPLPPLRLEQVTEEPRDFEEALLLPDESDTVTEETEGLTARELPADSQVTEGGLRAQDPHSDGDSVPTEEFGLSSTEEERHSSTEGRGV